MKVLKIVERIFFVLAVIVAIAACCMSRALDEFSAKAAPGALTAVSGYYLLGAGIGIALLAVGALIRYNPNRIASLVGDGLVLSFFAILFGSCLAYLMSGGYYGITILLGLVAAILYAIYAIVRLIIFIVSIVKPAGTTDNDPDNDKRIILITKWKNLLDKGIITKDEFAVKRNEILDITEEKAD